MATTAHKNPLRAVRSGIRRVLTQAVVTREKGRELLDLRHRRSIDMLAALTVFAPNSAGNAPQKLSLALTDARQFFSFAEHVLRSAGRRLLPIEDIAAFPESDAERHAARELAGLFRHYCSDKSTVHEYHLVYGSILARLPQMTSMLEVGLGTNNTDVVSHMSVFGSPGASLRAFRDFAPTAQVFGADIDKRVLFEEERIRTFFVDQTRRETFEELGQHVPAEMDLVIDDGLHSPAANLAVLDFAMNRTSARGWIVIEDIAEAAVPVWQLIAAVISDRWHCRIVREKGAYMFIANRRAPVGAV